MSNKRLAGSGLSTLHTSPFMEKPPPNPVAEYYKDHGALLSRMDLEYLARADGRYLNVSGRYEFNPDEPKLIVRLGGSLVRVQTGPGGGGEGGPRGEVIGFSSASRRRLMRFIASLERDARPVFVTLTYPDIFPANMDKWKRDIDVFGKRLARNIPSGAFIWRIEFKERRSGKSAGLIAPHFHLLVYRASYRALLAWVSKAWWQIVGSENEDHLMAGTRVEHIYSWGGVMRYVGKYIAKTDDYPKEWQGRAWGVIGRKNLPWAVEVVIGLSDAESIKLVRLGRKMIKARGRTFSHGLAWIVNAERVLDYLEFLSGFTPD